MMHQLYHRRFTWGGVHWELGIKQGDREKRVQCDNHLPSQLAQFLGRLDMLLTFDEAIPWPISELAHDPYDSLGREWEKDEQNAER